MTKYEQETIINFNEDEKTASVYTYNKQLKIKLDKLCKEYPQEFSLRTKDNTGSKTYIIPKRYVSIRGPRKLSEQQKNDMKKRGSNIHKYKENLAQNH